MLDWHLCQICYPRETKLLLLLSLLLSLLLNIIFLILPLNIDCGYSLKPPYRDVSDCSSLSFEKDRPA